jgi:hypothetical protein
MIVVQRQNSNASAISWREQITLDEMITMMDSLNWFLNTAYFAVFGFTQKVLESTLTITQPMQFRLMRYIPLLIDEYKTTESIIIR